jgi:nucleotide-binding universal stress UspA family protein
VPDSFWDWEKDPLGPQYVAYLKDWEAMKESKIREFMQRSRQTLINAGVQEDLIKLRIQKRRSGIARDAVAEAKSGYNAVALGRTGQGAGAQPMLGSVASKLLGSLTNVPLCIVGGKPKLGRILIGMDSSTGASRAANFVGRDLSASDPSVILAHIVRNPERTNPEFASEPHIQKLIENAQNAITPVFTKVQKSLVNAGIKRSKITTKVVTGAASRAAALLDETRHGMIGSLVIGRRGLSEVVQFQMGRVAAKLTQISSDIALWIVA